MADVLGVLGMTVFSLEAFRLILTRKGGRVRLVPNQFDVYIGFADLLVSDPVAKDIKLCGVDTIMYRLEKLVEIMDFREIKNELFDQFASF